MVLLHMMASQYPDLPLGVAYCDHQIRSKESAINEKKLVSRLAQKFAIPFYSCQLPVKDYQYTQKVSLEMAARDCRYKALKTIMAQHHYTHLVLGHHYDDHLETIMLQLIHWKHFPLGWDSLGKLF